MQYRDVGSGPVLVLVHGFCESWEIFEGLLPSLSATCRVVAPNLPGHGGAGWDGSLRSLEDVACWLRDMLDALEIERCVLVGHSLGGYVSVAFAGLFPERLLGLGLLHSTSLADTAERRENRNKSIAFVKENGKELFLKAFVNSLFHAPELEWLLTLADISAPTSVEAILALLEIMRDRPDRRATLRALAVPVLYIMGGHDGLVSPERSRLELQDLPLALVKRIPEASHMGMYETPEKVVEAILSLVRTVR